MQMVPSISRILCSLFKARSPRWSLSYGQTESFRSANLISDECQETLKKPGLDRHADRCAGAVFSCLDCNTTFHGTSYRQHTKCVSEKEKYEKKVAKKRPPPNAPETPRDTIISQIKKRKRCLTKDHNEDSKLNQNDKLKKEVESNPKISPKKTIKKILKKHKNGLNIKELKCEIAKAHSIPAEEFEEKIVLHLKDKKIQVK